MSNVSPEVGMPVTICIGTDRYVSVISKVTAKTFSFEFQGDTWTARFTKGKWRANGCIIGVNVANEYQDPHF